MQRCPVHLEQTLRVWWSTGACCAIINTNTKYVHSSFSLTCILDWFIKTFFWKFRKFCSNIAPSLSSGNLLFNKAEYIGWSCLNQELLTGVHKRPQISIPELRFERPLQGYPTCSPFMSPGTEHLAPGKSGARPLHLAPGNSGAPAHGESPEPGHHHLYHFPENAFKMVWIVPALRSALYINCNSLFPCAFWSLCVVLRTSTFTTVNLDIAFCGWVDFRTSIVLCNIASVRVCILSHKSHSITFFMCNDLHCLQ